MQIADSGFFKKRGLGLGVMLVEEGEANDKGGGKGEIARLAPDYYVRWECWVGTMCEGNCGN